MRFNNNTSESDQSVFNITLNRDEFDVLVMAVEVSAGDISNIMSGQPTSISFPRGSTVPESLNRISPPILLYSSYYRSFIESTKGRSDEFKTGDISVDFSISELVPLCLALDYTFLVNRIAEIQKVRPFSILLTLFQKKQADEWFDYQLKIARQLLGKLSVGLV